MKELREGVRVRVVKDEVDAAFVGECGVISFSRSDGGWYVRLDIAPNVPIPYEDSDLSPVNVTVIEGDVERDALGKAYVTIDGIIYDIHRLEYLLNVKTAQRGNYRVSLRIEEVSP